MQVAICNTLLTSGRCTPLAMDTWTDPATKHCKLDSNNFSEIEPSIKPEKKVGHDSDWTTTPKQHASDEQTGNI
jgi:hypothetical protein